MEISSGYLILDRKIFTDIIAFHSNTPVKTHLPHAVTHIYVSELSIGSDDGLSPIRRQAIISTNAEFSMKFQSKYKTFH